MENYLGYSKAEMIADYNSDFYDSFVKKVKAAKYKLDSKKTADIENAILEQMRLERHTRTVFEDDDCVEKRKKPLFPSILPLLWLSGRP